jgi:hypothetical protein
MFAGDAAIRLTRRGLFRRPSGRRPRPGSSGWSPTLSRQIQRTARARNSFGHDKVGSSGHSSLSSARRGGWHGESGFGCCDPGAGRLRVCLFSRDGLQAIRPHKASCINRSFTGFVLKARPAACVMAASPNAPFARAANLSGIRWTSWGGLRAVGGGYELGFHLPYSHIRARIVLTRPAFVEELRIYVHKHFRVTSRYGTLSGTVQAG